MMGFVMGFVGRISCLQMYGSSLSPTQLKHLAPCPHDQSYLRSSQCTFNVKLRRDMVLSTIIIW